MAIAFEESPPTARALITPPGLVVLLPHQTAWRVPSGLHVQSPCASPKSRSKSVETPIWWMFAPSASMR